MKVSVVNPPLYVHKEFADWPYFANLGSLQAAAVLREKGHEVDLVDAFALPGSQVVEDDRGLWMGAPVEDIVQRCSKSDPQVVVIGLSAFIGVWTEDRVLRSIFTGMKESLGDTAVVLSDNYLGGMHYVEYSPEEVFARYPQAAGMVKYESEPHLHTAVTECGKSGGGRRVYHGRAADVHLDALPLPAWDMIDVGLYYAFLERVRSTVRRASGPGWIHGKTLPVMLTRGCIYACSFCCVNPDKRGLDASGKNTSPRSEWFRKYSLDYVRGLLDLLVDRLGAEHLCVLDGLANGDPEHFGHVVDLMNAFGVRYDFPNGIRADHLRLNQLERMKGRIPILSISPESGSQRVLDQVIGKRQKLPAVEQTAAWAKELGIPLLAHYIVGFPGESGGEINQTLRHARRMASEFGAYPTVQFATPLPGTTLEAGSTGTTPTIHANGAGPADYSLHFVSDPIPLDGWTPERLRRFKNTFNMRMRAERTQKIIINTTYRCNNFCTFCATGDRPGEHGDLHRYKKLLLDHAKQGVRNLDLDGGEPTLYPYLIEMIRGARSMGYENINVTTNGRRLIYEPFARDLLRSGITSLLISLHGHRADIHERNTQTPGSFEQTVRGLGTALALANGEVKVGVNTTLTRLNAPHVVEFTRFIHGLGVRWFNIQFTTPFGRAHEDVLPDQDEAIRSVREAILAFKDEVDIRVINLPPCLLGEDLADFAAADLYKNERVMIFGNEEGQNLAGYLGAKREKKDFCSACPYDLMCEGFYLWGDRQAASVGTPAIPLPA